MALTPLSGPRNAGLFYLPVRLVSTYFVARMTRTLREGGHMDWRGDPTPGYSNSHKARPKNRTCKVSWQQRFFVSSLPLPLNIHHTQPLRHPQKFPHRLLTFVKHVYKMRNRFSSRAPTTKVTVTPQGDTACSWSHRAYSIRCLWYVHTV